MRKAPFRTHKTSLTIFALLFPLSLSALKTVSRKSHASGTGSTYNTDGTLTLSLWVDPASSTETAPLSTLSITSTVTDINQIGLVRYSNGTGSATSALNIDDITIGTTWADVAVPEPHTGSLMLGSIGIALIVMALHQRQSKKDF